jgi:apolipoprotein N-acyltransferase
MEWLTGHLGDIAFPWLGLGMSLTGFPVLVQWADLAGGRGVTFWLAAANAVVALALLRPRQHQVAVALLLASCLAALGYGVYRERTLAVRPLGKVALIQPNIGFQEKWVPAEAERIVTDLHAQTRSVLKTTPADLVIWPEAAVPDYFVRRPDWAQGITALSREVHTPIFLGGLDARLNGSGRYEVFNAAFLFDSTGSWNRTPPYHKHYLVPIVERVPFVPPRWLSRLRFFGAFDRGSKAPIFQVGMGRFGAVICYESTFPDLARRYRREGADFLINVTNDKWYGLTTAPGQHASHLVMRAIETRMGIARAANSGISEVVSPLGYPSGRTALETRTAVVLQVETTDVIPLYVRWGDWVAVVALVLTASLGLAAWRAEARSRSAGST